MALVYERLKNIVRELGDRRDRLTVTQWLAPNYPVPSRINQIKLVCAEMERRARAARVGETYHIPEAPQADRRSRLVVDRLTRELKAKNVSLPDLVDARHKEERNGVREVLDCYRVAFDQLAENSGLKRAEDPAYRALHPDIEQEYQQLVDDATKIAIRSAAHILWYKRIARITEEKIGALETPIPRELTLRAVRNYPKSMGMCMEMEASQCTQWEMHVGRIFQRRLIEALLEDAELAAIEGKDKLAESAIRKY
jgi:hypothetical protein